MSSAPTPSLRGVIEQRLGINPDLKPKLYCQVFESVDLGSLNYWLELLFAAGIATLGLVLNSPAVVIGAMLISPLMGPILAAGLALAAADLYLGLKSLLNLAVSVLVAVTFSGILVWLLPFHSPTDEILARTQPNLLDLGVALFSGLAGSIVLCRGGGGGGVTALPGVAIAVALMPPLCTVGFGMGSGFSLPIMSGAGLLFLTNLAAIVASAFLVFFAVRMDAPDVRQRIDYSIIERASHDRLYRLLERTKLGRAFGDVGKLGWRALMLFAVLAVLFIPLRKSLLTLRDEIVARGAVRGAVRALAPADAIVSEQVELGAERILVRLVVTSPVDLPKIRETERDLKRGTGRDVTLSVRRVAAEEELASLRERLRTPAPRPLQDLEGIRAELLARLEKPLEESWPSNAAPVLDYELAFTPLGLLVRVRYLAEAPLDPVLEETLSNVLRARLDVRQLKLVLVHEAPPPPPSPPKPVRRRR